jgi:hypothetical protein
LAATYETAVPVATTWMKIPAPHEGDFDTGRVEEQREASGVSISPRPDHDFAVPEQNDDVAGDDPFAVCRVDPRASGN